MNLQQAYEKQKLIK